MITIKVKPTRELFFNDESSFGIYGCEVAPDFINDVKLNRYNTISIKGTTPKLELGQEYEVTIIEDKASKYEGSYELNSIRKERPQTIQQQKLFLSSILTEQQIESIYSVYNDSDNVIQLIEDGTFEFDKIKGIGQKTFEKLKEKVLSNIDMSEVLAFCTQFGIKYNMIKKLVEEYKNPQIVIDKINKNPFLLTEISGIGFKKADEIAKAVGFDLESPHRIRSAIKYVIEEEQQNGHSWIAEKVLFNRTTELLTLHKQLVLDVLAQGVKNVMNLDGKYTTKAVYDAEKNIARKIHEFRIASNKVFKEGEIEDFLDKYCEEHGIELEENQRQFFHDWNENNLLLLIGNAGMGKSYLVGILLKLIDTKNLTTSLLAPTGK